MATVGTLLAELALESSSFHRDLGKAVTSLQSGSSQMNKAIASVERQARTMNKVMGAAITGWVTTLGVDAVKAAWDFSNGIADMAKNTNVGTTALQEFRFAAKQSGGDVEALDAGLLKFNQVIGEAAQGSKAAVEALARVGITTDELKSKGVEQLFVEASDGLNKMGDSASRNAAMVDLFGKSATKTAEAFSLSASEMDNLRQAAHDAGAVMSDEAIAKAKAAADQFDALAMVLKVQATSALVEFGPLLVKTTQFLADLGDMATWAAKQIGLLDKSEDDAYQDMLARYAELEERKHKLGQFAGGILAGGQIAKIDAELAELDKKIAAKLAEYQAQQQAIEAGKPTAGASTGSVTTVTPVSSKEDPTKDQYIIDLAEKRDALREHYASQEEIDAQHYEYNKNLLSELRNQELISDSEFYSTKEQMELEHAARSGDIWAQAALERQQFDAMTWEQQTKTTLGFLEDITRGTSKENRALFEINKAASIANAIISTYEGVAKAWSLGPILGPPLAGVVLAAGMAQVASISKTTFGSSTATGTTGGTSSGSTATSYTSPSPYEPDTFGTDTSSQTATQIIIEGNLIGNQQFIDEELIPALDEAVNERDYVFIRGNSRQASEITSTT